ncbi:MAG: long-chain fatty acid--CoA ligase [Alphaproteobacteria bacterium]|nr:MAG: long-chain fatty acid--CoA ligase [Alphaproteobacteria bacterium]
MTERPWLKNYPAHVRWDKEYEGLPVHTLIEQAAAAFPGRPHLEFMGRVYRYRESFDLVRRLAAGLQEIGVQRGVHVGIFMPNCPQFVISYYAVLMAGGTVVNCSPLYSGEELAHQVRNSETRILITVDVPELHDKAMRLLDDTSLERVVTTRIEEALPLAKRFLYRLTGGRRRARLAFDGHRHLAWKDLMKWGGAPEPVEIDPKEDVAVLQYTGGTTGRPKGAMLTHANLTINAQQNRDWDPDAVPGREVMFGALPLFHVYAMTLVMNTTTLLGGEIAMLPKFELEAALKLIERRRVTMLPGVPTMFSAMLAYPGIGRYDLSSVKRCFSGGAPMPVELKRRFEAHIPGLKISEGYGLTEASPSVSANPPGKEGKPGSIGLPLPATELVIVDRDPPHAPLPLGETGEIAVRGPQVMKGYWKCPDETARTIVDGRMLLTGDIGHMDEDGYTFLVDRAKDLILVGGFNVYPRTIEEAIYRHPAVAEAAVIGVPDDYLGEVPKAFVVVKPGAELTADELLAFLKTRIGKHEMPRRIVFRDELPRTMVGKISRRALAEEDGQG